MGKYLDSIGLANLIGKIKTALSGKQATLVSGTNIKTVNNQSLLGSGNITISGGGGDGDYLPTKSPLIEEDRNQAALYFRDQTTSISMLDGEAAGYGGKNLSIGITQDSGASNPASISLQAYSEDYSTYSQVMLDSDGQITATGDVEVSGSVASSEITYTSGGGEIQLANPSKTARVCVTGTPNLRVDTSSNGGSSWTTHGYAFLSGTSRTANTVLAAPNGSAGGAGFRKLVAADMDGLGDTAHGTGQSGIASAKAAVSCASGTTVNLDSITLAAGTWLVTYSVEWASNASGRRVMTLTTNATSISSTPVYMESGAPANGLATNFSRTQVIVATSNTTRYLNAYQNSGKALNCRSCIQAVRIA